MLNTSEYCHCKEVDCQFVQQVQFCSSLRVSLRHGQGYLNLPSLVFGGSSINGSVQCCSIPLRTPGFGDERTDPIDPMLNPPNHAQPIFHGPIFKVDSVGSKMFQGSSLRHQPQLEAADAQLLHPEDSETQDPVVHNYRYYSCGMPAAMSPQFRQLPTIPGRNISFFDTDPQISTGFGPVAPIGSPARSIGGQTCGRKRTTLFRVNHDKALSQPRKGLLLPRSRIFASKPCVWENDQ